ncbi:glycosyltransferase family 2 protein [Paenibacillus sp. KS-LC4]|uniref:glycosyltransferase family 2 protein n=1 Tax=Paenibacillus sp. KS-LC4 TaxID=2979727 RepID=UPI0030D2AC43
MRRIAARKRHRNTRQARVRQQASHAQGVEQGYRDGRQAGFNSYNEKFQGTSIIIPSYNQLQYLKMCIESIMDHTDLAYEIIVIDNASTDGTGSYLSQLDGQVRYRILSENFGFAGAVNRGMMMAKGTMMLILNNDTLVTDNWLDNMIACLDSNPQIGMVGPVTNYIGGEQLIEVPYTNVADMPDFARLNNVPDARRWQQVDRLTGFCLLLRRELWEKIGYFDEGFEIGNFEDDDYNIRVKLLGYSLVIARDSFIHHFGSVSIKALGAQLEEVNNRNLQHYMNKWGNPHELVSVMKHRFAEQPALLAEIAVLGEAAYYPDSIAVTSIKGLVYWIEGGVRRPVEGEFAGEVIHIGQIDIRRWPIGPPISSEEVHARRQQLLVMEGSELHGKIVSGLDGFHYYMQQGLKRKMITEAAYEGWALTARPSVQLTMEQLHAIPEGLPIIPAVKLRQHL